MIKKLQICLFAILCLHVQNVQGQCMTYELPLPQKVNESTAIFEGKVISKNSFWNASQDFIYTSNVIQVYKVFKGNITSGQVEIISEGGTIGLIMIKAEPSLQLNIDDVGARTSFPIRIQFYHLHCNLPGSQQTSHSLNMI
jgi:hypothetical protein